MPDFVSVN